MKRYLKFIAVAAAAGTMFTACVGDLETQPLNETQKTAATVYGTDPSGYLGGLARIYFQFVSNDLTDLQLTDGGASELIRAYWSLNEVSADAAKCAWNGDAWVAAVNTNTWSEADNDAAYAVYVRTVQGISFANEFLRQTQDLSALTSENAKIVESYRAEARFLRAYYYWIDMDCFGAVPFTTEESPVGIEGPVQKSRTDIFNWIVGELKDLVSSGSAMPEARSNYPRADKGSVWGLLARIYLNAEVYTGTAMWNEAKAACEEIFKLGYGLASNYADVFRGDNGSNPDVQKEMLFAIDYNAEQTQSYGGSSFLAFAAIADSDVTSESRPNGVNGGWGGIRVPFDYVNLYFSPSGQDYSTGDYTIADKRGRVFYIKGRKEDMSELYDFSYGWSCFKFNNIPHDQTEEQFRATAGIKAYSDVDFPLIRLGEIYLIYAEACMHTGASSSALPYLRQLSERAGVEAPTTITTDYLVAERARELMWEGHRRTDLIRYGLYNSASYLWPWKGGSYTGQGFDKHLNIFAIPASELASNTNLVQNEGYKVAGK